MGAQVADFNLSRAMQAESVPHSGLINSPEWAAPERLSGQVRCKACGNRMHVGNAESDVREPQVGLLQLTRDMKVDGCFGYLSFLCGTSSVSI